MAKVLLTGLNHNQVPYLNEIKKMGFEIIGTDLFENPPGKEICDKFYKCSYSDFEKLIEICKVEQFCNKDKVFTASSQESYLSLAKVAEYFEILFTPFNSIETAIGKEKLYKFFEEKGVPFPDTEFIYSKEQLAKSYDSGVFYLKSDYSKNPNYIYKLGKDFDLEHVNWEKDRYLKECYILQKEFLGQHLRFNIFSDYFTLYEFEVGNYNKIEQIDGENLKNMKDLQIPQKLQSVCNLLNLNKFLVKFDVILNEESYVVLDIGIDPPYRMRNHYENLGFNFAKMYIEHYLLNKISYPIKENL